jgi:hypothetical protein
MSTLTLTSTAHVLVGEPASTSPEHALYERNANFLHPAGSIRRDE